MIYVMTAAFDEGTIECCELLIKIFDKNHVFKELLCVLCNSYIVESFITGLIKQLKLDNINEIHSLRSNRI